MPGQNFNNERKKSETGKKVLNFLITDRNRRKISRLLKNKARLKMIRQISREQESHLDDILRNALKHINPVTQPPVIISQVRYSGGGMLNRLFDGHPELNSLPPEIGAGSTLINLGSEIEPGAKKPQDWFEAVFRKVEPEIMRKDVSGCDTAGAELPFVFLPLIQQQIFLKYLEAKEPITRRDVIDAYITASFGAWLDYQNLSGEKKFTAVHAPDLAAQQKSMEGFFELYPEGRLISIVRNPEEWLGSALIHEPEIYSHTSSAVDHWKESVQALIEINNKFKDRVCLIRFEDLVNRTDAVMQYLSSFLNISFQDILLIPTFNSIPLHSPNSPETNRTQTASGYLFDAKELDQKQRTTIKDTTQIDYRNILRKSAGI